jgi:hypothetical protein
LTTTYGKKNSEVSHPEKLIFTQDGAFHLGKMQILPQMKDI